MVTYTGHTHPLSKDSYTGTCEDGNTHSDKGDHLHTYMRLMAGE